MEEGLKLAFPGWNPLPMPISPNEDIEAREFLDESGKAGPQPMTELELSGVVVSLIQNAINHIDEDESPVRAEATRYYRGEPFGDEETGRSMVVTQDVRDTIMQMMPSLMRTFFGSEKSLEFVPHGPEDVELAEQMTAYVSHILLENSSFQQFEAAFQDALLKRVGIIKTSWLELEEIEEARYTGLGEQELQVLLMDNDNEDTSVDSYPDPDWQPPPPQEPQVMPDGTIVQPPNPEPPMLHDAVIRRRTHDGRVQCVAIPPEEFLIDRRARSIQDAQIVAQRRFVTVSELTQMGYDPEIMEQYAGVADELAYNQEAYQRNPSSFLFYDQRNDESMKSVLYIESYIYIDFDGDGIAELRRICTAGGAHKIVMNEPVNEQPFHVFTPYPEAHRWRGMSVFDITRDIQNIKSHVLRNMLDSLALSIFPRLAVVDTQVNIEDCLSTEMGSILRQKQPGSIQQMTLPFVGQAAFPMMQYLDELKEARTGMTRTSAGLTPEHLQSSTAIAVSAQMSASQQQLELVSRNFAETLKGIYRAIQRMVMRHQQKPRMIRLEKGYIPMDPRTWNSHFDVEVNVAIGDSSTSEKVGTLMNIINKQEQIFEQMGDNNPLVGLKQYVNTLQKTVELAGLKDVGNYFGNQEYRPPPPEPPKPTPEELLAEVQRQQIQASMEIEAAKLELDRQEMAQKDDRERDKMEAELQIKIAELENRYNTSIDVASIKAAIDRERITHRNTDA